MQGREETQTLLPFILKLTAVAAALLFCFSLFIQKSSLPAGNGIEAERRPFWEIEGQVVDEGLYRRHRPGSGATGGRVVE